MDRVAFRALLVISMLAPAALAENREGAETIPFFGYDDCIRLFNADCEAVLTPSMGGKALTYSWQGKNVLCEIPSEAGYRYDPDDKTRIMSAGGRFDIGPEKIVPRRPEWFVGPWKGEIIGPRKARMTSVDLPEIGVRLIREIELDPEGSRLVCSQTMVNISSGQTNWCYWSRTLAVGGGTCVIPLAGPSKYPNSYVRYESGNAINIRPTDPAVYQEGDWLVVDGPPKNPKLGMDSEAGWFAYLAPNDLMFVKRYPVYPDRNYNEAAGLTISIWYVDKWDGWLDTVELEPIGPRERLAPGESATFTEEWWLAPRTFAGRGAPHDLPSVEAQARSLMAGER